HQAQQHEDPTGRTGEQSRHHFFCLASTAKTSPQKPVRLGNRIGSVKNDLWRVRVRLLRTNLSRRRAIGSDERDRSERRPIPRNRRLSAKHPCHSTQAIRSTLVAPGVPNGTPAVTTIRSPRAANPSSSATPVARCTISAKLLTSLVWTQCTPQTSARRR